MSASESMKSRWSNSETREVLLAGARKAGEKSHVAAIERDRQVEEAGVRECAKCHKPTPLSEFPKGKLNKRGLPRYAYCKICHRENQWILRIKKFFNLTPEDYRKISDHQGGVCAICKRPPKNVRLNVDHDHKTGLIRGLLCPWCNRIVGLFRDNPIYFQNTVVYLGNPPGVAALGAPRYGLKGRVSNKAATRKRLNKSTPSLERL